MKLIKMVKICKIFPHFSFVQNTFTASNPPPLFFQYFLVVEYTYFILYSAERAWAVKPSPCASTEAILPSSDAPSAEQLINDERF